MEPSLNLTPHRGPSVWDVPEAESHAWMFGLAAGAAVAALALGAGSGRRGRMAGIAAGATLATLALTYVPIRRRLETLRVQTQTRSRIREGEQLDHTLRQSFPASDPTAVP